LRDSALFSAPDIAELERAAVTSGLDPRRTVPLVIGGKVLLIIACPMLAYAAGTLGGLAMPTRLMATALATAVGMLGPNWVLGWMRRSHAAALQRGLPDALDLLVVCAEAGLGLESAVDRIALELQRSNPAVAQEFASLGQELRMSADRSAALMKMGERTGLENFQRLAGTLAQTLRYGTPLGQALRVLAAEMRDERMMRLEERAARLPVLLTMPLILFILPCLFIVLGGPAAIKILNAMS
jgi:tight adherence protein C